VVTVLLFVSATLDVINEVVVPSATMLLGSAVFMSFDGVAYKMDGDKTRKSKKKKILFLFIEIFNNSITKKFILKNRFCQVEIL